MTKKIIGVCGLTCYKCPKFKQNDCKGCSPQIPSEVCPLPSCAQKRGVSLCFECAKFPCKNNYQKGPIVTALLDFWKGNGENDE